ncbi:MAG: MFS transporter [Eubacterium sp.]|jgi:sugar phosphate permease
MDSVNSTKKSGAKKGITRKIAAILIVGFAGAIIYGLPYFRYDYYDAYLECYNLTDAQMGVFGSILGVFGMISYLFGGVVADRFSTKGVLSVSLIATGIGGFIHLLPLSYHQLIVLYAYWGITSLFAFWPCCIKAVRILSDDDSQGKAYGFFEGSRGIAAGLMSTGAVIAFKIGAGQMEDQIAGMKATIIFYSIITIVMGVLVIFFVKENKSEMSDRVTFKGLGKLIRMPAIWIIAIVTFSNYVFTLSLYYFTPYMTELLGATVVFAAAVAASKRWFSLLGNVGGGFITDKVGTGRMLLISFIVMVVGIFAMLMLPLSSGSIWPFTILFVIVYIFYNVNYAMTWAMMGEGAIPKELSGSAAGFISTVGYLPEIFVSLVAGNLLDKNPGVTGYRYFFGFVEVMLLIGVAFVIIWIAYLRKHKAQLDAAKAEMAETSGTVAENVETEEKTENVQA